MCIPESAMGNGLEKRKFQRLEYPLEVTVEIVSVGEVPKGPPPLQMKSRNISKEGICLETKFLEVDGLNLLSGRPGARENRLHLIIKLIPEEPTFKTIGELSWYDVARDTPEFMYHLGVEFIDIKGNGMEQLVRFLKNHKIDSITRNLSDIKKFWRK
jgi:hypothetical protein